MCMTVLIMLPKFNGRVMNNWFLLYVFTLFLCYVPDSSAQKLDIACMRDKAAAATHMVVAIDLSESYTIEMIDQVKGALEKLSAKLHRADRISFFAFNTQTAFSTMLPRAHTCTQFDVKGNPLTTNPKYEKAALKRLNKFIADQVDQIMLNLGSVDSPIAEAITALTRSAYVKEAATQVQLVLVTDLLQSSPALDLYKTRLHSKNSEGLSKKLVSDLAPNLKGWEITVLKIQREKDMRWQNEHQLEAFWRQFFSFAGTGANPVFQDIR